jgi:hypothetical protein
MLEGDVWYQGQQDAFSQRLAYVNNAGRAVIRVDNTTNVPLGGNRSSVSCADNTSIMSS